ncbi:MULTISPECIES: DUF7009 family protein [unclassified Robiginitalea]|uniref:DUF7009 family protein n=1 Tax=Robiginitalea TaxID=252306 RepID=UPI00234A4CD3|nr:MULTISPECIES: hypothetical protein [unclassified Robiginitalea]MDC6354869.1 hypothetical protein [Robiginitalea sp. PM2]MDC6375135.1 hypothetical protein [Robiginitalea sp. SP8]
MKIRIKGNSVRYRLTRAEVETFCKIGNIEEETVFPSGVFRYILRAEVGVAEPKADFTRGAVTVTLPASAREGWLEDTRVGYSNSADWNDPGALSVLVEKDFACLDNTVEDQSDNFPNPNAEC